MKKRYKVIIGIILVLIGIRLYLPYLVKNYVNKVLRDLPGYTGSVEDIDLHLYRGAYVIDSLHILKSDSGVQVPFFTADRIDLSLQWNAIFKGAVVGEIDFLHPEVNFVAASDTSQTQYGEDVDWTKPIKDLIPVRINRLGVEDGTVHFRNFQSNPQIDLYLNDVWMEATNLSNSEGMEEKLPSSLSGRAVSIGGGKLDVSGKLNLLKTIPDMDINLKFEEVKLNALNDFLKVYSGIDAERGVFNMYSEVVIDSGMVNGYVKPLIRDLKVVQWSEDKKKPLQLIWESVAGLIIELFENQKKDQFATKVPFSGDLNQPNTKIFTAIWNVFSNAFIDAFEMKTDGTINFNGEDEQ